MLRNVGVHTVVLDLLQVPYDEKEDVQMKELMSLAHEFLQNFCLGNQQNQVLLHNQLDLFLNPGVRKILSIKFAGKYFEFFFLSQFADTRS